MFSVSLVLANVSSCTSLVISVKVLCFLCKSHVVNESLVFSIAVLYEGHSLCFAIWIFKNIYNHSVYSGF